MKEGMLEVLIYLFENYIVDELSLDPDQDELAEELVGAGFASAEIDKAFIWLEDLLDICEADPDSLRSAQKSKSTRFYNDREMDYLHSDGVALITRLVNVGVLDQSSRETVIDRVMALDSSNVNLDHIRWVILMVLGNQPGFDEISEWAEVMVVGGMPPVMH